MSTGLETTPLPEVLTRPGLMSPETAETWWDPFLVARHRARLTVGDRSPFDVLRSGPGEDRVLVTNLVDSHVRRFHFSEMRLGVDQVEISLDRGERPHTTPALRPGEAVNVSWFDGERWWGACGHVRMAGRSTAHVSLPYAAWSFEVDDALYDSVAAVAGLFPGFDPTLGVREALFAVNHPLRVNDAFAAAQHGLRPALLFVHELGLFLTARFQEAERRTNGALARDSLVFELRSTELDADVWRRGGNITVSSVLNGQVVAFRSRLTEGRGRLLRCERPAAYLRWERRAAPRFPMGAVAGYELFVPVHFRADGLVSARVQSILDVSAGGLRFLVPTGLAQGLDLQNHQATLRIQGKHLFDLPLRPVSSRGVEGGLTAVSAAFEALDLLCEQEINRLCARISGQIRSGLPL